MEQIDDIALVVDTDLIRIPVKDAATICTTAGLDDEANPRPIANESPKEYLGRLLEAKCDQRALTFLAYALPKREVIWWACVAFRHHLGGNANEQDERALDVAEAWVFQPDQKLCEAAGAIAEENGYRTPTALIAASVYWAGDSLAPPDCPKVPPRDDLTHKGVSSAISLYLLTSTDAALRDQMAKTLLSTGIKIAQGATSKTALLGGTNNGSLPNGHTR